MPPRKKILIVDDDQDLVVGLAVRLRKVGGYDVIMAADGLGGITKAQREKPDLIILDLGLPVGDGFSVLERLKTLTTTALIPVIVLSARDPGEAQNAVLDMGADAFFQKPADNDQLLAVIRKVLGEE
ncbi:MAG: response regulator [Lentisphaeria bacterium]